MKSGDLMEVLEITTFTASKVRQKSTMEGPERFILDFHVSVVHLGLQSGVEGKNCSGPNHAASKQGTALQHPTGTNDATQSLSWKMKKSFEVRSRRKDKLWYTQLLARMYAVRFPPCDDPTSSLCQC